MAKSSMRRKSLKTGRPKSRSSRITEKIILGVLTLVVNTRLYFIVMAKSDVLILAMPKRERLR